MHKDILTEPQIRLLPEVKKLSNEFSFGLVGGTAVALYLGHRRSVDFDLFTNKDFSTESIKIRSLNRCWLRSYRS